MGVGEHRRSLIQSKKEKKKREARNDKQLENMGQIKCTK